MINQFDYHNKINTNLLMDYPGENNKFIEVKSFKYTIWSIFDINSVDDDVFDDLVVLLLVTRKETLNLTIILQNFLVQYKNTISKFLKKREKSRMKSF